MIFQSKTWASRPCHEIPAAERWEKEYSEAGAPVNLDDLRYCDCGRSGDA